MSVFRRTCSCLKRGLLFAPMVLILFCNPTQAESRTALLKVGYLHKFAKFIEWPTEAFSSKGAIFALCVLGTDSFVGALPSIQGKPIKGRKLEIKYFAQEAPEKGCHILFVSASEADRVSQIIPPRQLTPSLTVADFERFAHSGGMINFTTEGSKTRFAINLKAAQRAGLRIRSKLLKLAISVETDAS